MQAPWCLAVTGGSPVAYTVISTEQLVVLTASIELPSNVAVESAIDSSSNLQLLTSAGQDALHKFLLCAEVEAAQYDTSYDGYGCAKTTVILAAFDRGSPQSTQVKLSVRSGSTLTLNLVSATAVSAEYLCATAVSLTGVLLTGLPPPAGWRPVLHRKWFVVKPHVRKTTVKFSPPHVLAPHRRAGEVGEVRCVSNCGTMVRWSNAVESPTQEVMPFRKILTPARVTKAVRVRKYPHRNADILDEVPFGCERTAVGQQIDEATGEMYVCWEDGGWSRVQGADGPFLIERRLENCVVFPSSKLYTSAREGKGVRIRDAPSLKAREIGSMEANEVREALALHSDEDGNQFVQWKAGGYSCVGGLHGSFLVELLPLHQSLRQPVLRASPRAPSPDVIDVGRCARKRARDSESDSLSEAELDPTSRKGSHNPPNVGISPGLVPQELHDNVKQGKVNISVLPRVSLNGEDSDDEECHGVCSDDDEWSDDGEYESDDYDEDAADDDDDSDWEGDDDA